MRPAQLPGLAIEVQDENHMGLHETNHHQISETQSACNIAATAGAKFTLNMSIRRHMFASDYVAYYLYVDGSLVDDLIWNSTDNVTYRAKGCWNKDDSSFREMSFGRLVLGDAPTLTIDGDTAKEVGKISACFRASDIRFDANINDSNDWDASYGRDRSVEEADDGLDKHVLNEKVFKGNAATLCATYGEAQSGDPIVVIPSVQKGPTYWFHFYYGRPHTFKEGQVRLGAEAGANETDSIAIDRETPIKQERDIGGATRSVSRHPVAGDSDDEALFVREETRSKRPRRIIDLTSDEEAPRKRSRR
ncbi:Hypothetical protein D9617_4g000630 [Elsinoe fawcettii]|nr:Hypothetical protein D9617_4g000630 [Elsinoe fawcettii]